MNNYFIIHGSYGNPYKNWIPWLKGEMSKRKINCIVPDFPSPIKQDYNSWQTILKAYLDIGYITEETSFIAHSLGGIFITKFLIENKIKIKKLITVAGFNNIKFSDNNDLYDSFYLSDEELKNVKDYCKKIICIYSNNDPYVLLSKAEEFANEINAEKCLIKEAGHFNKKYGYDKFTEILRYI